MSWINCDFSSIHDYYTARTRYESAKPFGYCKPIGGDRYNRHYQGNRPTPMDNERPIDNNDSQRIKWHMRLVKNDDMSFSCWFYHQEMVRYFPPGPDGSWRALTVTGCTNGDKQFMDLVAPDGFDTGDGYLCFTERTDRYVSDSDYGETKVVRGRHGGYDMIEVGYNCTKNNYWVNMKDTAPFVRYGVKTDRAIAAPIQREYRFKEFEEFLHVCRLHGNYHPIQRVFGQPYYGDRDRLYKLKQSHPYMSDAQLAQHLCDDLKWGKLVRYLEWQGRQYRQLKETVLAPAVTKTTTTMLFAPSRKVARRWA